MNNRPMNAVRRLGSLQSVWILGVLLVIVLLFSIAAGDRFLSAGNFSLISQNIAVWAVLGVGMTFVIITSGIDLSVGSVLGLSAYVAANVKERVGGDGWSVAGIGVLPALVSGVAWGALNGFLVAKARVPALIVPLGTLSVALGLAQVLTGGIDIRSVPEALTDFSTYISIAGIPGLPFVALVVVILGGILLHRTRFGRYTFAIGSNQIAARRVGINVDRHLIAVYALAGALAGFGAVLALAQFGTPTLAGQSRPHLPRGAVAHHPHGERRGGLRRHVDLRRRGLHLRHRGRPVHPCGPAGRLRDHRCGVVLAGRRRRLGAGGRGLRRPDPPRRRSTWHPL